MKALRDRLEAALVERDQVRTLDQPAAGAPPIHAPHPISVSPLEPPPVEPPPPAAAPAPRGLVGVWVYVPSPNTPAGGSYPAEYVELVVTGKGPLLAGRYRGRYRVSDRALSPEVRFTFEGPPGSTFHWTGNGGARGEVEIQLVGEHTLSVAWFTSEAGQVPALTSGSATLIRRLDP
jgi:hypothetical protein